MTRYDEHYPFRGGQWDYPHSYLNDRCSHMTYALWLLNAGWCSGVGHLCGYGDLVQWIWEKIAYVCRCPLWFNAIYVRDVTEIKSKLESLWIAIWSFSQLQVCLSSDNRSIIGWKASVKYSLPCFACQLFPICATGHDWEQRCLHNSTHLNPYPKSHSSQSHPKSQCCSNWNSTQIECPQVHISSNVLPSASSRNTWKDTL